MYKVVKTFVDLQDKEKHRYIEGDEYPRAGLSPSRDRIAELSSTKNKRGVKLIEKVYEKTVEEKPEEEVKSTKEEPKKATKKRTRRKKQE